MDSKYFKKQIYEELDGAECYIRKAIELKPMAPAWSKMLAEMSSSELTHAEHLYKMFNEYYQKMTSTYKVVPAYIQEANNEIQEMYTERPSKIKSLHTMYSQ